MWHHDCKIDHRFFTCLYACNFTMCLCCHFQQKVEPNSSFTETGCDHATCCGQWDISTLGTRRCSITLTHWGLSSYCHWNRSDHHHGNEPLLACRMRKDVGPSFPSTTADSKPVAGHEWNQPAQLSFSQPQKSARLAQTRNTNQLIYRILEK